MKTTAFDPQVLRSLAAAMCTILAVSCDKPATTTSREHNSRTTGRSESSMTESRASRTRTSGFNWTAGDSSSYKLDLGYGFTGSSKEAVTSGMTISGNYHFAVLSADAGTVTATAAVSEAKVLRGGKECAILENLVNSNTAVLTLSEDGAIREIAFNADLPAQDRQFLRAIYGWEFQMRAGAASWTTKETEINTGRQFLSSYNSASNGTVKKTRNLVAGAEGLVQEILVSEFAAKLGRCWLDSLQGRETIAISHEGKSMGESLVTISLARTKSMELPEIVKGLLASAPQPGEFTLEPTAAATGTTSAFEKIRINTLREKFTGVPYEIPFKALEKVADTGSHADSLPALHNFRDLLLAQPELAPLVADSLKSGVSPRLSSLLAHSLELANTEASQKTLASILSHPGDYSSTVLAQSIVAAGGLGALKDPAISEALDIIQSSYPGDQGEYPLNDAALFSLSRLAPANPELQQPLINALTPMLSSSDEETRCTAVLALANAELFNEDLTGLVENLFTSREPQTRAAALAYFEGAPDLGADQIQSVAGMLNDANVPVQLQAVATLAAAGQNGNPQSLAALRKITADNSASDDVRQAAQSALEAAAATAGK